MNKLAIALLALISTASAETYISLDPLKMDYPKEEFIESMEMVMSGEFEKSLMARFTEKTGAVEFKRTNEIVELSFDPLKFQIVCRGIAGFENEAEQCFWTLLVEKRRDIARKNKDEKLESFEEQLLQKRSLYDQAITEESDREKARELREEYRASTLEWNKLRNHASRGFGHMPRWRSQRFPSEEAMRIEEVIDKTRMFTATNTFRMTERHQKLTGASKQQVDDFNLLSENLWKAISAREKKAKTLKPSPKGIEVFIPAENGFIEPLMDDYLSSVREIFEPQIIEAKYTRLFIKKLEDKFWTLGQDRVISMEEYVGKPDRPGAVTFDAFWIHEGRERRGYRSGGAFYEIPEEYSHLFNSIEEVKTQPGGGDQ